MFASDGTTNVSVINDSTNTIVATIQVPLGPGSLAYDPNVGDVFAADPGFSNVSVLNDTSNTLTAIFGLGGSVLPQSLLLDPGNGELYVGDAGIGEGGGVTVLNASSGQVITQVNTSVPGYARYAVCAMALAPRQGEVYAAQCGGSGIVNVINTSRNLVSANLLLNDTQGLDGIAYDAVSDEIVANGGASGVALTAINPSSNAVVGVGVGNGTGYSALTYDTLGDDLLALEFPSPGSPGLGIYNGSTLSPEGNVSLGSNLPVALGIDPKQDAAYVAEELGPGGASGQFGTVVINLTQPYPFSIAVSRASADVGEPIWFNVSNGGYAGSLDYQYSAPTGLGCLASASASVECVPGVPGDFSVEVNVTAVGQSGPLWTASSVVVPISPALAAALSLSNSTLWLGDSLGITTTATGGLGPLNISLDGLPPGCVYQNQPQFGCIPTESGNYSITFVVLDANGWAARSASPLTVEFDFEVAMPASVAVGQALTIHIVSAPGFGGLDYGYSGLPSGCIAADTPTLSCTPSQTGTFDVRIMVHDASGDERTHLEVLTVVPRGGSGLFGLPGETGYYLIGLAVACVVVAAAVLTVRASSLRGNSSNQAPPSSPPSLEGDEEVRSHIKFIGKDENDLGSDLY